MTVTIQDFQNLQQRVMLIEGGNTPTHRELVNEIKSVDSSVKQLADNTTQGIIAIRSELGLSIDGVEEQLNTNIADVKLTLNQRFDRLLEYLNNWVGVGNVNMDDVKDYVGNPESSTGSSSTGSSSGVLPTTSQVAELRNEINAVNSKLDSVIEHLRTWIKLGNVSMEDIPR